jgi:hypothetical protein
LSAEAIMKDAKATQMYAKDQDGSLASSHSLISSITSISEKIQINKIKAASVHKYFFSFRERSNSYILVLPILALLVILVKTGIYYY